MQKKRSQDVAREPAATNLRTFRTFLLVREFATEEIGERIARARKQAGGMTQEQLADLLDVSKRSLQDYEAGKTIPWKYFQLLEKILKRPLEWFLYGEEGTATTALDADDLAAALDRLEAVEARQRELAERLEQLLRDPEPREAGEQ
jgi:transcriptional regulator with XRE-family HTH domain